MYQDHGDLWREEAVWLRILGIDPGYAIVGYGIIEYRNNRFTTIAYGAITTPADMDFNGRLREIYRDMCHLLDVYKPEQMAVEKLFFTTNQKTAIDVAQARGVIMLSAAEREIPVFEYTPLQVKQAVVGYGKAIKAQVMDMTKRLLNLEKVPKPDDTADALAIAICHAHSAPTNLSYYRLLNK